MKSKSIFMLVSAQAESVRLMLPGRQTQVQCQVTELQAQRRPADRQTRGHSSATIRRSSHLFSQYDELKVNKVPVSSFGAIWTIWKHFDIRTRTLELKWRFPTVPSTSERETLRGQIMEDYSYFLAWICYFFFSLTLLNEGFFSIR